MMWLASANAEEFWYQHENCEVGTAHFEPADVEGFELVRPPSEPYSPSVGHQMKILKLSQFHRSVMSATDLCWAETMQLRMRSVMQRSQLP